MKNTILRYGLVSAAIVVGVNIVVLLIFGVPGPEDYAMGEVIGYATIIVALVPVFFGIRSYRDDLSGGTITFWKAFGVGTAISAVPSVAFAIYNLVYVSWIDPDFSEKYMEYSLSSARSEMTPEEFQAYAAELQAQTELLTNPVLGTVLMFLTVFVIGLVVAIASAIVLRKPRGT